MIIKLDENGKWGGIIPDILRHNRISININGVVLRFSGKEFDQLRSFLDESIRNLYIDAKKVVAQYDKRNEITKQFYEQATLIFKKIDEPGIAFDLEQLIDRFYGAYWNIDLDELKDNLSKK